MIFRQTVAGQAPLSNEAVVVAMLLVQAEVVALEVVVKLLVPIPKHQ